MKLLAFETATEACSVALWHEGEVTERYEIAPRRHAELALPFAQALLDEAGIAKSALDAIAVGRGPGAFTGVRLAIALAQGLALALDRPVVTVSTLAALALAVPTDDSNGSAILAVIDARMGEIYAGAFERDADGLVTPIADEVLCHAEKLELPDRPRWSVLGTGWAAYEQALRARLATAPAHTDGSALPHAAAVARLAVREYARGNAVDAVLAQPVYLRDKVALTLIEQQRPR
jgi:tRNA threonylcarbamoyladenosine biosynthesis protein TsaB